MRMREAGIPPEQESRVRKRGDFPVGEGGKLTPRERESARARTRRFPDSYFASWVQSQLPKLDLKIWTQTLEL